MTPFHPISVQSSLSGLEKLAANEGLKAGLGAAAGSLLGGSLKHVAPEALGSGTIGAAIGGSMSGAGGAAAKGHILGRLASLPIAIPVANAYPKGDAAIALSNILAATGAGLSAGRVASRRAAAQRAVELAKNRSTLALAGGLGAAGLGGYLLARGTNSHK